MLDTITTDAAGRPQAAIRNKSDESLIASIAKGDREAMEVFYVRHKQSASMRDSLCAQPVGGGRGDE
jgi:hypothetical protein